MVRIFTEIINDGLTPNGLYFLMTVTEGTGVKIINYHLEKRLLESSGFIENNKITQKGYQVIEKYKKIYKEAFSKSGKKKKSFSPQDEEMIYQYRELFPKGMLPSGSPARQAYKELEKKFNWFFINYDYNWDVIIAATKLYINKYQQENYMYMKTSGYFILKNEKGVEVSTLATYCDMVLDLKQTAQPIENQLDNPSENNTYSSAI